MTPRGTDTHCNLSAEQNTGAESDRIDNRHRKTGHV
ncbi:hypothetical protein RLEG3_21745 [Rhizobium leguminosarum bv. trifolii WSM1689]|nr:hypothetical protein RLEG3_21745 [Rhizobium leguminosarum bv. trifolii WSM1689]